MHYGVVWQEGIVRDGYLDQPMLEMMSNRMDCTFVLRTRRGMGIQVMTAEGKTLAVVGPDEFAGLPQAGGRQGQDGLFEMYLRRELSEGDTVVFRKPSDMAATPKRAAGIYRTILDKGAGIRFIGRSTLNSEHLLGWIRHELWQLDSIMEVVYKDEAQEDENTFRGQLQDAGKEDKKKCSGDL